MARRKVWRVEDNIASGLMPGLPNENPILWESGENVVFRERGMTPEPGQFTLFNKLQTNPVLGMAEVLQDNNPVLYWGTPDKLFRGDINAATPVTEVGTGYAGVVQPTFSQKQTRWSIESWGSWVLATNGLDDVQIDRRDGSGFVALKATATLPAEFTEPPDFRPEILLKVKNFMLAFNTDDGTEAGKVRVWWTDADDILTWEPTASNQAGRITIRDMPSPIHAALALGEGAAVYSTNTLHLIQFIGSPNVFAASHILSGIGALSKHAVIPVGRVHYGFGPRGIWRTDGTQAVYIDQPRVHRHIFDDFNRYESSRVHGMHDPSLERVVWWYPKDSGGFGQIGFDYRNETWHIPGYVRTATSSASVFQFPVTGDADGNIYHQAVEDLPVSPDAEPLALDDSFTLSGLGYGEGGYGSGGYGGTVSG